MSNDTPIEYRIRGQYQGYTVEIEMTGRLAQLPLLVERLKANGVEPLPVASAPQRPAQRPQQGAELPEPWYNDAGDACCPWHRKPLREGRYGQYCPSRAEGDQANDKGYCRFSVRA